jgi:3-mercaptopyruvate sulfurtransferase SseA
MSKASEIEILINRVESLENQFNQFKQSHTSTSPEQPPTEQPKERIEVEGFYEVGGKLSNYDGRAFKYYSFNVKESIPKEKYGAIKQAIEAVLNDDIQEETMLDKIIRNRSEFNAATDIIKYSQQQLDEAIREAKIKGFRDSRLHHPLAGLKFDNETDYKQSLNQ